MRIEIVHDGTTHGADVSLWNGRARSLCGHTFAAGKFEEKWLRGSVTCRDCREARKGRTKS